MPKNSSGVIVLLTFFAPRISDRPSACSTSENPLFSNPTEKVSSGLRHPVINEESIPPDRNAPTGTSD